MRYTDDVGRGDWIGPRLHDWSTILGVVPSGYDAYARIFHPVEVQRIEWRNDDWRSASQETLTWSEAASRLGKTAHPLMQWGSLMQGQSDPAPGEDGWQWAGPNGGALPPAQLAAASAVLAGHSSTPDRCIAALWEGWGWVHGSVTRLVAVATDTRDPVEVEKLVKEASRPDPPAFTPDILSGPRLELPERAYLLFETNLAELATPGWDGGRMWNDWPNLLWPDDHAWCLASEIDFDSTLVGGSRALIDDLLATDGIEVAELPPDASLHWNADTINGPPPNPIE